MSKRTFTIIPRFIWRGWKYFLIRKWYAIDKLRWSKYKIIDCGSFSLSFEKIDKTEIRYGLFGELVAHYDKQGFTEILVVIQDSGMYAGAAPKELMISEVVPFNDPKFAKQWIAKLNRRADLPYRLYKAKVKILDCGELIKDSDLIPLNIEPLPERLEV